MAFKATTFTENAILKKNNSIILIFFTMFMLSLAASINFAQANDINKVFSRHDANSTVVPDHSIWDRLLKTYITKGNDDLNLVNYKAFKETGRVDLTKYLKLLEATDVTKLNRADQYAFWLNLYNAKTIDVVLDHYPVASIRDIDISPGIFSNGPWGKKVTTINGIALSLDDIEHKILRVLWKDPRVHYGVNCASIGCPNLATEAYTGEKLDAQLDTGAIGFVNSTRGVKVENGNVTVSKIYSWFNEDFGSSEENILKHIRQYASTDLKKQLEGKADIYDYEYDWALNEPKGGA